MAQRAVYVKQEDERCLSEEANAKNVSIEKLVQLIVTEHCTNRRTKK